ncbi:anaerobic ribonucleoside-triphosphate reductase [[Ruminococcus] lactaris ATCC 29176]|uniref:Anaerobic ribonucleoside-triphosphate reductase n=5 Tax=[Ruminococcus] lactaris TaxID=46228 RepID=B5CN22_9FIRM|nr:anaerobic ribonucleoside-triphosphate reductase [[Ruminococcus] lactaris ATCC 29176]
MFFPLHYTIFCIRIDFRQYLESEETGGMKIIKRNGSEEVFDINKIIKAVKKADINSEERSLSDGQIEDIAEYVEFKCNKLNRAVSVEEIQDMVENQIMATGAFELAKSYVRYRYKRSLVRKANTTDNRILSLIEYNNEDVKQENSNKNPAVNSVQRDYMAGEVSRDLTTRMLLPEDIVEADRQGIIHFHDSDYYAQHMHNCDLVNLEDMLQNGTVISGTMIEKPHSFSTACNIATQIIAQVASNQYGGQSISLAHLAPFVQVSRNKIRTEVLEEMKLVGTEYPDDILNEIVERRLKKEITKGVQTIEYQVITLMTTNGQAPFLTVFMYLNEAKSESEKRDLAMIIEETLRQRYQGVKNEAGVWVTPAFPKLIYVLEDDNIEEGSEYFYLTELAAKCTAKRLVPDYISEKKMKELKEGNCFPVMGCRSCLSPWKDENGNYQFYGRFNQGVVTINLVDVALSSGGDMNKFWKIFDERLELCYRALMCRHNRLKGTLSDAAPILWQFGALARLKKGEPIDKLLYGGYSTISLGYAGLYECVKYMTGKSHTDPEATPFALDVMKHMNEACNKWKEETNIAFSIYGSPIESTTYKFAKCLQKRFGVIPGITDKSYITNSYHVFVGEEIDAFAKLKFESQFQALSTGGAISYVEVPDMKDNIPAVLQVIRFIYENIMYAELNTKSDYCQECGFDGEIQVVTDEEGKLVWECPHCGNRNQDTLNVARRTCGYIGTQFWNQGRTQEIKERVLHL